MILGKAWHKDHNCCFNWTDRTMYCQNEEQMLWVNLVNPKESSTPKAPPLLLYGNEELSFEEESEEEPSSLASSSNEPPTSQSDDEQVSSTTPKQEKQVYPEQIWVQKDMLMTKPSETQKWVIKASLLQPPNHVTSIQKVKRRKFAGSTTYKWVHKGQLETHKDNVKSYASTTNKRKKKCVQQTTFVQRWVRKDLLQAQANQQFVWVPRKNSPKSNLTSPPPIRKRQKSPQQTKRSPTQNIRQIWLPKSQVHKVNDCLAWILKRPHSSPMSNAGSSDPRPKISPPKPEKKPKQKPQVKHTIWIPKKNSKSVREMNNQQTSLKQHVDTKKMCLRALELQKKLFGLTSVLLKPRSWLELVRKEQGFRQLPAQPWKEFVRSRQGYRLIPEHSGKHSIKVILVSEH